MSFNPVQLKSALLNKNVLDLMNYLLSIISNSEVPCLKDVYRVETQSVVNLKGP